MPRSATLHLCVVLLTLLPWRSEGHGRLLEPPSRASMWRLGYSTPKNYLDNQMFCGGFSNQWDVQGGRCGVCGDPWQGPREHEAGGKYATGLVTRRYHVSAVISVLVQITASHKGYFEFRLCPVNNPKKMATPECMDRYLLRLADGSGTRYHVTRTGPFNYSIKLQLPEGLECSQCVLQWKYNAGNSWGVGEDGRGCPGCGQQEQFYGCADIAIGTMTDFVPYVEPTTGPHVEWTTLVPNRPLTTTAGVPSVSTARASTASAATKDVDGEGDVLDISSEDWSMGLDTLLGLLTVDRPTTGQNYHIDRGDTKSNSPSRSAEKGEAAKQDSGAKTEIPRSDTQSHQDTDIHNSVGGTYFNSESSEHQNQESHSNVNEHRPTSELDGLSTGGIDVSAREVSPDLGGDIFGSESLSTSEVDAYGRDSRFGLNADFTDSESYSDFDADIPEAIPLLYHEEALSDAGDLFGSASVLEYPKEGQDEQLIVERPLLYRDQYQPDGYYEYEVPSHVYYSDHQSPGTANLDQEYIGGDLNYLGGDQEFVGDDLQYIEEDQQDSVDYFSFLDRGMNDGGASVRDEEYDYGGLLNDILSIVDDQPAQSAESANRNEEVARTITGHGKLRHNTSEVLVNDTGAVLAGHKDIKDISLGNRSSGNDKLIERNETKTTVQHEGIYQTAGYNKTLTGTTACGPMCRTQRAAAAHKYSFLDALKKSARTSTVRPEG